MLKIMTNTNKLQQLKELNDILFDRNFFPEINTLGGENNFPCFIFVKYDNDIVFESRVLITDEINNNHRGYVGLVRKQYKNVTEENILDYYKNFYMECMRYKHYGKIVNEDKMNIKVFQEDEDNQLYITLPNSENYY